MWRKVANLDTSGSGEINECQDWPVSAVCRSGGEYGRGHGEVDCGLHSHCGSPGHSVASHSGPPGRGMASLVAPSNGTDLITGIYLSPLMIEMNSSVIFR